MQKIIGVTELQRRFRSVFDDVAKRRIPYVLTRGSRPEAVMIPYEEFLRYQQLQETDVLARFDELTTRMAAQNAAVDEAEIEADVAAAAERNRRLMRVVVDTNILVRAVDQTTGERRAGISPSARGQLYTALFRRYSGRTRGCPESPAHPPQISAHDRRHRNGCCAHLVARRGSCPRPVNNRLSRSKGR